MNVETIVRLKIFGVDFDPTQTVTRFNLSPDRIWKIGDFRPKTSILETTNGFIIGSGLPTTTPHNEQIIALFNNLGKETCSAFLRLKVNVELSCVIYSDQIPCLYLERDVVQMASSIDASIDFDVYILNRADEKMPGK
jgi:hypothetical protein